MAGYHVDVDSFRDGFPEGASAPPLLEAFGAWLKEIPQGSIGDFSALSSELLDATYTGDDDATEALRPKLGIFLHLPDGSRLALWYHGDGPACVVNIGSEGELENVAPTLEAFLIALGNGQTGVHDLDENRGPSRRPELLAWLAAQGVRSQGGPAPPNFEAWFEATVDQAQKQAAERARKPPGGGVATNVVPFDLTARVETLLGKLTTDPAIIELCADLGFDLESIRNVDLLRDLARPEHGYALEFAWPWDYPNRGLQQAHPPEKRREMEKARARMLWGITFHATGDLSVSRAHNPKLVFAGFPGPLPKGIRFDDTRASLLERLGPPRQDVGGSLSWFDAAADRTLNVWLSDAKTSPLPEGAIRYVRYRVRSGFEPS